MFGFAPEHIILILIVGILVFGAGKLPQIGDSMGKAIRNFKKAASEHDEVVDITPSEKKKISEGDEKKQS